MSHVPIYGKPRVGTSQGRRNRKKVDDYVAENQDELTSCIMHRQGQAVQLLICRFCSIKISPRADRIREHMQSKRHQKLKEDALNNSNGYSPEPDWNFLKSSYNCQSVTVVPGMFPNSTGNYASTLSSSSPSQYQAGYEELTQNRIGGNSSTATVRNGSKTNLRGCYSKESSPPSALPLPSFPTEGKNLIIKWNSFDSNLSSTFSRFWDQGLLTDVTLYCEGRSIPCHKIMLSAHSSYLENLLHDVPGDNPVVVLSNMRFVELEAILRLFYEGEIKLSTDNCVGLVKAADILKLKSGLNTSPIFEATSSTATTPVPKDFQIVCNNPTAGKTVIVAGGGSTSDTTPPPPPTKMQRLGRRFQAGSEADGKQSMFCGEFNEQSITSRQAPLSVTPSVAPPPLPEVVVAAAAATPASTSWGVYQPMTDGGNLIIEKRSDSPDSDSSVEFIGEFKQGKNVQRNTKDNVLPEVIVKPTQPNIPQQSCGGNEQHDQNVNGHSQLTQQENANAMDIDQWLRNFIVYHTQNTTQQETQFL